MKSLKNLIVLIASLWLGGCTVHVHRYSCTGAQCPQPVAVQRTVHQPSAYRHTVYRRAPAARRHGPNCRHSATRRVSCKQLNKSTKRCYARWM